MRTVLHQLRQQTASDVTKRSASSTTPNRLDHPLLKLQRTVGNQAVLRMMSAPGAQLRRACDCGGGGKSTGGECDECKLSRKAQGSAAGGAPAPAIVGEVLRSPGRPLDPATRDSMGARFQIDFGGVRVHDDARAAESALAVSAQAYTVGHHVVFGRGQYAPASASGRRLLAHELAHVAQQPAPSMATPQPITVGDADSPAEREADAVADALTADAPVPPLSGPHAAQLHRKQLDGTGDHEPMLNLGSPKSLACCDTNACAVDDGGFDCSGFDCPKETGDKDAKNNLEKKPGKQFMPHLRCDSGCSKDFKPTYTDDVKVVAMPKKRESKTKNQCNETLGLCANGKSVEVTIREFSNHNVWEASPAVWTALGVDPHGKGNPDLFVSIFDTENDPDMNGDRNCNSKPSKKTTKDKTSKDKSKDKTDKKKLKDKSPPTKSKGADEKSNDEER